MFKGLALTLSIDGLFSVGAGDKGGLIRRGLIRRGLIRRAYFIKKSSALQSTRSRTDYFLSIKNNNASCEFTCFHFSEGIVNFIERDTF